MPKNKQSQHQYPASKIKLIPDTWEQIQTVTALTSGTWLVAGALIGMALGGPIGAGIGAAAGLFSGAIVGFLGSVVRHWQLGSFDQKRNDTQTSTKTFPPAPLRDTTDIQHTLGIKPTSQKTTSVSTHYDQPTNTPSTPQSAIQIIPTSARQADLDDCDDDDCDDDCSTSFSEGALYSPT